ncbi:AIM24 family protein [Phycicoccus sp. CSK15P-2]|nr:AIM24 family protein [Phycicoccus sp. CSK15P-2]
MLTYGNPVLRVDMPTFVDMQSAVLWSGGLQSSVRKTAKLGAVVGRGSGEAYQLALSGEGIVVVQTSEGHPAPSSGS